MGIMDSQFDYIWNRFLKRLEAEIHRTSQADVARRLGVNRGQVSKWLSGLQVGGNLKTFVTHIERLGIPFGNLINPDIAPEIETPYTTKWKPTPFEKHLAATLKAGAKLLGKSERNICSQGYGTNAENEVDRVREMIRGKAPIGVEDFYKICTGIGLPPTDVLSRAASLSAEGIEEDASRRTA